MTTINLSILWGHPQENLNQVFSRDSWPGLMVDWSRFEEEYGICSWWLRRKLNYSVKDTKGSLRSLINN